MDSISLINSILSITQHISSISESLSDATRQAKARQEAMDYLAEKYCLPPVEASSTVGEKTTDWTPWLTKVIALIREILDYGKERIFVVGPTGQADQRQVTLVSDQIRVVCGDLACFFLIMIPQLLVKWIAFEALRPGRACLRWVEGGVSCLPCV